MNCVCAEALSIAPHLGLASPDFVYADDPHRFSKWANATITVRDIEVRGLYMYSERQRADALARRTETEELVDP